MEGNDAVEGQDKGTSNLGLPKKVPQTRWLRTTENYLVQNQGVGVAVLSLRLWERILPGLFPASGCCQ